MAVDKCPSAHCSGVSQAINMICKSQGWAVNHPVLVTDPNDPNKLCYCSCSCLAFGTPVQAGDGSFRAIEDYQVGDTVLAAGKSLTWTEQEVVFSNGTPGVAKQKYTVLIIYSDGFLAVTSDHLFLMPNGTLKAAAKITPNDELVAPDGSSIAILSVHIGDYTAGFHHITTSKEEPAESLDGHLLNTNGVVSADYTVQLYYRANELPTAFLSANLAADPIVGSSEYCALYGDDCLKAPSQPQVASLVASFDVPDQLPGVLFTPAEKVRLNIPDDAAPFISKEEAKLRANDPKRAFNDPFAREWTEYLLKFHKAFYPDVVYHLDWTDEEVNAYAWVENGVRHVALLGGLVRHRALELEGIALVLAHELGHHYGGPPTYPSGLSCEGQADWHGVANIMREVWFGQFYGQVVTPAIAQMADFFGVPNVSTVPGGSAGCTHPAGACRIATYYAAVSLVAGKPACAE